MRPAVYVNGPLKGQEIPGHVIWEVSDNVCRKIVHLEPEHVQASNAALARFGPDSLGGVNLVPADRPGLSVMGEKETILRPGPASHHFIDAELPEADWSDVLASLEAAGVPFTVTDAEKGGREEADAALAKHGRAVQLIRKGQLKDMPAEAIERLIATMDAKCIADGVDVWIKDGAESRSDKVEIVAAVDAKTAEIEAAKEPPADEPIKVPAPAPTKK